MYPEWEGNEMVERNQHCPYFADFSGVSEEERLSAPARHIGEDNYEILEQWGLSREEAKALLTKWGATNV